MTTLIFFRADGFYPIEVPETGRTIEQVAKDNALLNPGTIRVETIEGEQLWPSPRRPGD